MSTGRFFDSMLATGPFGLGLLGLGRLGLGLFGLGISGLVVTPATAQSAEALPPGVEQLLPRGKIAAVFEPQFVSATEAEIPDDAWILGVVVDGAARAYSLNLLNRHEIVNDRVGEKAFAAVW
jgi:hypothetical protein